MFLAKYIDSGWSIAIRKAENNLLLCNGNLSTPFHVLKNSWRYWCADPFLFNHNGTDYIFCEAFDILRDRGIIAYRTIDKQGRVSPPHPCLITARHLSYPHIFKYGNNIYMIPESGSAREIAVYRAEHFPDRWSKCACLLSEIAACDTNLVEHNGTYYLFTLVFDDAQPQYIYDTLVVYRWNGTEFVLLKEPFLRDASTARNGGKMYAQHEDLFRVSQDCSRTYGERIHFSQVLHLDHEQYRERRVTSVGVADVVVDRKKHYTGIHTYNFDSHYEVIDLYEEKQFHFSRFLYLILNKLHLLRFLHL